MINKLLYLTYIQMENVPNSGSSVRPQKMKTAMEKLGLEVKTFSGINNRLDIRKGTVADIKKLLKTWKPDACYIEPPSGPMFYYGDVRLIKKIHHMGIPIAIFYRDAFWKYPELYIQKNVPLMQRLKHMVIKRMQVYQWNVFRNNIDIIYFPSVTMADEFDCPKKDVLPPGTFVADVVEKKTLSNPLQVIFVGGASNSYGTFLTIKAFEKLNKSEIKAKLFYICPQEQWKQLGIEKEKYSDWLEVIHTSGDKNLKPYYEKTDIAWYTAPRNFYNDFAVPIKIFEYMSYLKPIIVTDCTERARIVNNNKVGWVVKDDADSIYKKMKELCYDTEQIEEMKKHMKAARVNNLWVSRAKKIIEDLEKI